MLEVADGEKPTAGAKSELGKQGNERIIIGIDQNATVQRV